MSKTISDFAVLQKMSDDNLDISCHLEQLNFQRDKRGGKVTIGVACPAFDHLINQAASGQTTHYGIFYVINKEQFEKIKKEMQDDRSKD